MKKFTFLLATFGCVLGSLVYGQSKTNSSTPWNTGNFVSAKAGADCGQGDSRVTPENGGQIAQNADFGYADDFLVSANNTLSVGAIELNIMAYKYPQFANQVQSMTFVFRDDNNGIPGNIVKTISNVVPSSEEQIGDFSATIKYFKVTTNITDELKFEGGTTGKRYWMQPLVKLFGTSAGNFAYWEWTSNGTLGKVMHWKGPAGEWKPATNPAGQAVFKIYCKETPATDCSYNTPSNSFQNGFGNLHLRQVANDFKVEANKKFKIDEFKLNVGLYAGETVNKMNIYIYSDTGNGPGTLLTSYEGITPTASKIGSMGGGVFDAVEAIAKFSPYELAGGANGTTYWIAATITTDSTLSSWESTTIANSSNEVYVKESGIWLPIRTAFPNTPVFYDGVFTVSGTCEMLAIDDIASSVNFTYYPNPVTNYLNINSRKAINSVSVYDMSSKLISQKIGNFNGQINVESLKSGNYLVKIVFDGGEAKTFKIIKQ